MSPLTKALRSRKWVAGIIAALLPALAPILRLSPEVADWAAKALLATAGIEGLADAASAIRGGTAPGARGAA